MNISEILSLAFMQRALIVGILLGISCAILGVFLVLKKYSMIGDGLAHVSFAAVAIAMVANLSPIYVAIPIVIFSSFIIEYLTRTGKTEGDAAIAIISSTAIAIGVIIASVGKGFNIDLMSYLFGSILTVNNTDIVLASIIASIAIFVLISGYKYFFAIIFDEKFAKVQGVNTKIYNIIILILTSVIIVIGMKILGSLLISSLIIFPTVSSLNISKNFKITILNAILISVAAIVIGILISYPLDFPTGATIVIVNLFFYIFTYLINSIKN